MTKRPNIQAAKDPNRVVIEVVILLVEFMVLACVMQWAMTTRL